MAEIRQTEYQDRNGNIYHFHTDSEIVKYNDTTVKKYLDSLENNNIGSPIIEATGTNNYIGSSARITSIGKGTKCTLFVENDSTGNCTLNINGLGVKNIKDSNGNIVTNLKSNIPYNLCYNGSDFILQGKGGGGNLIPKYLLTGYYGESDNGRVDGTMVNRGAPTTSLNCGGTYNISEGYYSGGKITVNSLASQMANNGVTLTSANQLMNGVKAISKTGQLLTGTATIQSLGGVNIVSGTTTCTIDNDYYGYINLPNVNFPIKVLCGIINNHEFLYDTINGMRIIPTVTGSGSYSSIHYNNPLGTNPIGNSRIMVHKPNSNRKTSSICRPGEEYTVWYTAIG